VSAVFAAEVPDRSRLPARIAHALDSVRIAAPIVRRCDRGLYIGASFLILRLPDDFASDVVRDVPATGFDALAAGSDVIDRVHGYAPEPPEDLLNPALIGMLSHPRGLSWYPAEQVAAIDACCGSGTWRQNTVNASLSQNGVLVAALGRFDGRPEHGWKR
jgi:hypothetical protein